MEISLRPASPSELPTVHAIMRQAFEEYRGKLTPPSGALSETIEDISSKIEANGGAILAQDGNAAVGSAQFFIHEDYVYIGRVSVLPTHRGSGIAKQMVAYIENHARQLGVVQTRLEVRLSIPANVAYYKKLDYNVLSLHAYPDETDYWYVMGKVLTN
ncbi:GNAT family N-acetyltransferase [Paenibacillus sp. MMS18-CY102]|uniref:GNAT family N-acetyltransferase n=1 Tax=Paenibacillus sp. MMS18-CY102 TaxID=2682849 RepID=UPI001365F4AF|nr:GNAT family N-acetyltransferase [Paenibacillus sp. MMS18-CY102]MWC27736.1 GNAT family N-acetyltransferase [Paenibacillus sp. MMS18-CY102]